MFSSLFKSFSSIKRKPEIKIRHSVQTNNFFDINYREIQVKSSVSHECMVDCNELFTSLAKGNFITQTDGKSLGKNDTQGYFYDPLRLIP